MEKSSCFKLLFLVFLLINISASTFARMQPTNVMKELAREQQVLEQLGAYKQIITSAAMRNAQLLRMVRGGLAQQCGKRGAYCNTNKDCCAGFTCREDDDQDYYTGYTTCV